MGDRKLRAIGMVALTLVATCNVARSEQPTAKIVGVGATSCAQYIRDIDAKPDVQKDYLAWAQGYMSGILMSRPPGVDEQLDLAPSAIPLLAQARFLKERCSTLLERNFSEVVEMLYKHLRPSNK